MYISIDQLTQSLEKLKGINPFFGMSYLAFKKAKIPVGKAMPAVFTPMVTSFLARHNKPSSSYRGYYNPFHTSKLEENRWTQPRYPNTTLQRITADTFGDALIHPKGSKTWGWRPEYIKILKKHLGAQLIPAFDLAVWLFRDEVWPANASRTAITDRLFSEYLITPNEVQELFDLSTPLMPTQWLVEKPLSERELFAVIGNPPGAVPEGGGALRSLQLKAVGPARLFDYEPAERLNIITGDNSLGKTFLLDCIWWALTQEWIDRNAALPWKSVSKNLPKISFEVSLSGRAPQKFTANYNWEQQNWTLPRTRTSIAGLVVYARFDGSFAVWDPARLSMPDRVGRTYEQEREPIHLLFNRENIWNGLFSNEKREWLSNGLLRDWVSWQMSGDRYSDRWKALVASLKRLSPSGETMEPGNPTKKPFVDTDIPTLKMPYGEVQILHTSAGVQRAIALAYILVWTWFRHVDNSEAIRKPPERRLVLIVDEVEAHLHPRWQRVIVPSIMDVLSEIAPSVSPQIHLATHSPMVMASAETVYDEDMDDLHHLKLEGNEVVLSEIPFTKRGRTDLWLMSDVFGLAQARSLPAEEAIGDAIALQEAKTVAPEDVRKVNSRLIKYLAQDDDFWPLWRFFAKTRGVG